MTILLERGGIILILIIALSVIAAAINIERLLFFRRIRGDENTLINRLRSVLDKALAICEANPSPLANLMRVGIEHRGYSQSIIRSSITDAANLEIPRMERYLSALGTIAHISPLLGLLGTVTGNIEAFGVLGNFGAVGDPSILARGISEALITTAAGIIVSIPAIIFYNHLVSKVNHLIIRLENRVSDMVLLLGGDSEGGSRSPVGTAEGSDAV